MFYTLSSFPLNRPIWALGFMSGTSADGVDGATLLTDGERILEQGPMGFLPYDAGMQSAIKSLFGLTTPCAETEALDKQIIDAHLDLYAELKADFLKTFPKERLELIGFHGQTLFHAPPRTWQLGDAQCLATRCGVPVVADLRQNDLWHGGQGAPLVPIYHQALYPDGGVIVNIGGVSNITIVKENTLVAGDVGPGSALLDDWVSARHPHHRYDPEGTFSQNGTPHEGLLYQWEQHPFFKKPLPKSLDRNTFSACLTDIQAAPLSLEDGAATLALFTARSIARSCRPYAPLSIRLCGGGRHNIFLKNQLQGLLPDQLVDIMDNDSVNGDFVEAQAFAYLAVRCMRALPLTFPGTTGVLSPLTGGKVFTPASM